MYYYGVTETEDPIIQRTAYGIVGEDGRGHSTAVENISCDREFVARLAERCTRGQLAPEHLMDVVQDALP